MNGLRILLALGALALLIMPLGLFSADYARGANAPLDAESSISQNKDAQGEKEASQEEKESSQVPQSANSNAKDLDKKGEAQVSHIESMSSALKNGENAQDAVQDAAQDSSVQDAFDSAQQQHKYPGVSNAHIERGGNGSPSLSIFYPVFDKPLVDEQIRAWAENLASHFEKGISEFIGSAAEKPENYDLWELSSTFTLEKPNPNIVSLTFSTYSYSGGAHGNLGIDCLNFDLKSGKRLEFADLFKNPEKALEILSELSAKKLRVALGEDADEEMIRNGTALDLGNFYNLTLVPQGLYIEFDPYQVGPWSIGPQRVEISLEELKPAGPEALIWPENNSGKPESALPEPKAGLASDNKLSSKAK